MTCTPPRRRPTTATGVSPTSSTATAACTAIPISPPTPVRERKRIARLLLTDVTVTRTSDTITAHVRLAGGQHRTLTLPVPKRAWEIRQTPAATIAEIDRLLDHHTCAEIAGILRRRGREHLAN